MECTWPTWTLEAGRNRIIFNVHKKLSDNFTLQNTDLVSVFITTNVRFGKIITYTLIYRFLHILCCIDGL